MPAGHRGNVSLSELTGFKSAGGETRSLENGGIPQRLSSHDSTGDGHLDSNLDIGGPAGLVGAAINDPFAFKGLPQKLNAWQPLRTRDCVMTALDSLGMLGGLVPLPSLAKQAGSFRPIRNRSDVFA